MTADSLAAASSETGAEKVVIFGQTSTLLRLVESEVLGVHGLAPCTLLLDGSVPAAKRGSLIDAFRTRADARILLSTVSVGGLGINLSVASTVIFLEHDWNPVVDLQAVDRVHRIGQRKVVNVFRLISKGTIEEKVLQLQKHKLETAGRIVGADNADIEHAIGASVAELLGAGADGTGDTAGKNASGMASGAGGSAVGAFTGTDEADGDEDIDALDLDHFIGRLRGSN